MIVCKPLWLALSVVAATFLYRGPNAVIQSFSVEFDCGLVLLEESMDC